MTVSLAKEISMEAAEMVFSSDLCIFPLKKRRIMAKLKFSSTPRCIWSESFPLLLNACYGLFTAQICEITITNFQWHQKLFIIVLTAILFVSPLSSCRSRPPLQFWQTRKSTQTSSAPSRRTTPSTRRWWSSSTTTTGAGWGPSRRTSRGSPRLVLLFPHTNLLHWRHELN